MWTHKERVNSIRQLETARENVHRMLTDTPTSDKAKEAFKRPLFGGVKKSLGEAKDEQK